jgi:hypothetical protein
MSRFLGFTTYPIKFPVHGGQRRIRAFVEFYRSLGIEYDTACVYEAGHYGLAQVASHDVPLDHFETDLAEFPFVGDLMSGLFAATQVRVREHFQKLILERKPNALVLEQPFMWPLIKTLRAHPQIKDIPILYSSQNWEPPLKLDILERSGIDRKIAQRVGQQIEDLERELVEQSKLVIAVSDTDAGIYRALSPTTPITVVKNGVDRSKAELARETGVLRELRRDRYFFFVGSAYPPNVDGICSLLMDGGLFFVPPEKTFAVCGGAAAGTFRDTRYQKFLHANSERVKFFERIEDKDLDLLKSNAHAVILPINYGGGSNLKTAEALVTGKWIVATSISLRGYEEFSGEPGILIADDRESFRKAVMQVYRRPALELSEEAKSLRESVYWDRRFDLLRTRLSELDLVKGSTVGSPD